MQDQWSHCDNSVSGNKDHRWSNGAFPFSTGSHTITRASGKLAQSAVPVIVTLIEQFSTTRDPWITEGLAPRRPIFKPFASRERLSSDVEFPN